MLIKINNETEIKIIEPNLVVKNKRLYNTETKQYEGVDGDIVIFSYVNENGLKCGFKGYVEGYTNGKTVKVRGVDKVFNQIGNKTIDHVSIVTNFEDSEEELLAAEN